MFHSRDCFYGKEHIFIHFELFCCTSCLTLRLKGSMISRKMVLCTKDFSLATLKAIFDWCGEMFAVVVEAAKEIFIESLRFLDPLRRLLFHSVWVVISLVKRNKPEWFNEVFTCPLDFKVLLFIMFSSSHTDSSISISSPILCCYAAKMRVLWSISTCILSVIIFVVIYFLILVKQFFCILPLFYVNIFS